MASAPLACLVSGLTADDDEDAAALAVLAALRAHLAPLGGTVAAMTPLTRDGQPRPGGGWHSPRVARLTAAASFAVPQHAACPFVLPAGAPREGLGAAAVAATADGPGLRAQPVREAFQVLATWADAVVMAGIGGWLTPPVAPGAPATGPLLASMCQRLHLPLLLCSRLDAEAPERARRAMKLAGLRPVAWLAMRSAQQTVADDDARVAQLQAAFHAPCVGRLGPRDPAAALPLADGAPQQAIDIPALLACLPGRTVAAPAAATAGPSQITQDGPPRAGR
ncbi:hypothetical protein AACH10_14555 [Ideonella sp. DXS22W]|uniref:Uncharacterized protein n=1 Tax=Pseudaquabacterium inlustre TaxID=2984192 RepID=A0ABU9CI81_9BURK